MDKSRIRRRSKGQGILETVAGCLVFIPISLFGLDVMTMAVVGTMNNHLAKDAARAAANQEDSQRAHIAARAIVGGMPKSVIVTDVTLAELSYEANSKVSVKTTILVKLPAPFPFFDRVTFAAQATEAVVGAPVEFQEAS